MNEFTFSSLFFILCSWVQKSPPTFFVSGDFAHSLYSLVETCRTIVRMRRGRIHPARGTVGLKCTNDRIRRGEPVCSPVAHAIARAPPLEIVGAGYILPVAPPTGNAPAPKASLVKGRWVALKGDSEGFRTPQHRYSARFSANSYCLHESPRIALIGDPTPFDKGVIRAANSSRNIYLTVVPRAHTWVRPYEVRRWCGRFRRARWSRPPLVL